MQLLASWKQSLSIFYPLNNLKLFGFAILRAVQVAVPQFFMSFWWLIGVLLLGMYFDVPVDLFVTPCMVVFIYLIVRPSVGIKNFDYVKNHSRHIFGGVILSLLLALVSLAVAEGENLVFSGSESFYMNTFAWIFIIVDVLVLTTLFSLVPLWFFFFLDSRATLGDFFVSWKYAFLMAVYAFPLWIILFVVLEWVMGLLEMVGVVGAFWAVSIMTVVSVCVQIVVACIWSVFYTKRLHEQFEVYFPGPQIKG